MTQPVLKTKRLLLRPFTLADASVVQKLAGAKEIADVTANVPHPYLDGMAEQWISTHVDNFNSKTTITYAITLADTGELIGCVSMIDVSSEQPELGYWIGLDYWGNGYCTEASKELIAYCTKAFELEAVYGKHLTRNPASGKVMEKCGLSFFETDTGKGPFMDVAEELKVYRMLL